MSHGGSEGPADDLAPIGKAAILLLAMGEDEAAKVLRLLEPREVQRVGAALSALGNVDSRQIDEVVNHFLETVSGASGSTMGANDYLRSMLIGAFGEQRARSLLERVVEANVASLDKLKWMDSRAIAEFVLREQPQMQAVVLSYLPPRQAAEVLDYFPTDATRGDVIVRMVKLVSAPRGTFQNLPSCAEPSEHFAQFGGKGAAAAILNHLHPETAAPVMTHIRWRDAALGAEIKELMRALRDVASSGDRDGSLR